jgi:hypothetical protein
MSSRMEKYDDVPLDGMSRTKRNQTIYNLTDMSNLSRIKTNTNVSVISDAPKEIDIEKIKNYVYSMEKEEDKKRSRISLDLPPEEEHKVERKEVKDYDINTVLEKAKDKRESDYEEERHRKISNTQLDILKNIKIRDEKIEEEKDPDITGPIEELNTEEKTIVDLIQDIQSHGKKKDLLADLMGDEDETVVAPIMDEEENKDTLKEELLNMTRELDKIKIPENEFTHEMNLEIEELKRAQEEDEENPTEEIEHMETTSVDAPRIKEIDKSFYTNSMTFNKSDFEGFEDLEGNVKKNSALTKVAIVFIVILLLATIFLILNFVLEWNIL